MPFIDLGKTKTNWKIPKGRAYRAYGPEVSILGKSRIIRLNPEAFQVLGSPKRVRVAWDMESQKLGIKATNVDDRDSYALTVTKSEGYVISAAALLRTIGMPAKSSGWLPAAMDGEYLAFAPFEGLQSAQEPLDNKPEEFAPLKDLFET